MNSRSIIGVLASISTVLFMGTTNALAATATPNEIPITTSNASHLSLVTHNGTQTLYDNQRHAYIVAVWHDGKRISLTQYLQHEQKLATQVEAIRKSPTSDGNMETQNSASATNMQNQGSTASPNDYIPKPDYTESYNSVINGATVQTSPIVECPVGLASCTVTRGISHTTSQSFSANVTSSDIPYVQAGAGFTWNVSATISESVSYTLKSGQEGYFTWQPIENYTYSVLHNYVNNTFLNVSGTSPKKLSDGEADGYISFYLE